MVSTENERLRYQAAAAYLGVSQAHLRWLVHAKKIDHIRVGPRTVLLERSALDEFLAARRVKAG